MKWNANELAWAKKNNVQLGQKKKGGLANVAAYRKSAGLPPQGGGGAPKPSGGLKMQPSGGQSLASYKGGGGLIQGRQSGASAAFGANQPTMRGSVKGGLLGGALGGAAGFYGSQAAAAYGGAKTGAVLSAFGKGASMLGGAGKMGAILGGPVGWGLAGAALGASILGSKKSNKQFEGTIQTGGAQPFQSTMAQVKEGYIPTADEFVQHGRWQLPEDSYAHDYGRTFTDKDRQYYGNFQKQAQAALDSGNKAQYKQILDAHGFGTHKKQAPVSHGGGSRPSIQAAPIEVPKPTQEQKNEVSPPASGLEDTITKPDITKTTKRKKGTEVSKKKYLTNARSVLRLSLIHI